MSKPKLFDNWIVRAASILVISIALLGIYHFGIKPNMPEPSYPPVGGIDQPTEPLFPYETVDSSSCVACHTSESIIAASKWVENQPVAENTGG